MLAFRFDGELAEFYNYLIWLSSHPTIITAPRAQGLNQPTSNKTVDSTTRGFPRNGRLNIPHESPVSDHETSLR